MPTDAVIPSTPLSLLPFINKNDQWSSDLETPQAEPQVKLRIKSTGKTEETPKLEQHTPDVLDKIISDSPVIARATRRRSKRRIFRSSISIDSSAVTNNEDITVEVETPAISNNTNFASRDDIAHVAKSDPSVENVFKDHKLQVPNKGQDTCNNENSENFNPVPDSSNTSTQEFFNDVSFSKIDELCFDAFDDRRATETFVTSCNYKWNIEGMDKGINVEENKSIGFFTGHGASINVSKQALFKAKRLFAEAFDTDEIQTRNYEPFAKRNKQINRHLPSSSFVNISSNTREEALSKPKPSREQPKNYDVTDCKKLFTNETFSEEASKVPVFLSTASGNPINISKEALLKAKTLLADESDNVDDDVFKKFYERSDNNSMTIKNVAVPSFPATNIRPIATSGKSKTLFAEQLNAAIESTSNKTDNEQCDINISNIRQSINFEPLPKSKTLFAERNDSLESTLRKEMYNSDNEIKRQEVNVSKIGFQTACNKPINISEQALSKAKALFAKLDDTYKAPVTKEIDNKMMGSETKISNIRLQSISSTDISEQISKVKESFEQLNTSLESVVNRANVNDKEENRQEAKISPRIRFQTAGGKSINISEQALSKAKTLFAKLDDKAPVVKEVDNKIKSSETKVSNMKLQCISSSEISEQISKVKESFEQLDTSLASAANRASVDDKVENGREAKVPSIGFQTARGTSIGVSKQALSRTKALLADLLDGPLEMDIPESTGRDEGIQKRDLVIPYGGLQTASGRQVPVSSNAALIARELLTDDCPDESNPGLARASLQKRELSETNADESTPQGRNRLSEMKKVRLSDEFHARRLFADNPCVDEARGPDEKEPVPFVADSVLGSPKSDAVESTESDAVGSPVIGRQPVSRKRKSSGHQRREARADKRILDKEDVTSRENIVRKAVSRGELEDDKPDTGTRKLAQVPEGRIKDDNVESREYGDTQVMMDFIDESTKILQDRLAAALDQEAIITAKRRHGSKRSVGHLYRYKQINFNARLSLREISGGTLPLPRSYRELVDRRIPPDVLEITAATAASYRFRCSDFYGNDVAYGNVGGIEMEDGARLILDENGDTGVWEFLRAFLAAPGVDPNLVPARWVENHYRWIVWKLASMDRMKFSEIELPRMLTPSRVMAQLKYRYDREIDRFQRPAIRRILEKDDVPSRRMILCVSSVVENNNVSMEVGKSPRVGVPKWRIELTDGWYSINACIDIGMVRSISTGKVKEGTKLAMSGAELLNCDQGFHPLEVPADVYLKLHTNSTRRARWDTKLGYTPCSGPIPIKLRNVCPSGGLIGKVTVVVARVYPMLYHEKTASGDSIVRNAKSEEKAQGKYEQQCWSKIEAFYANAEDFRRKGLSCETDDMAIQLSEDYENLSEESISKKRRDELLQELHEKEERFKQRMQSKLRESLPGPRQVSQLLKVRVCDENANAILSVWSPSEEVVDALKEGACVSLCNVVASGKRGTELQLTANRSAIFQPGKMRDASYPARACTPLCEITNSEFAPPYGEFDTVGLVCSVGPAPYGMKDFEAVHLASNDSSYLSILFWQGIAGYGYAEILTVGSIVACSNLEWRRATSWNVPAAYCTERSIFTRNPRRNHLYESFENLRNLITDPIKYVESCTFELNVELQKKSTPTRFVASKSTPIKIYNSMSNADKKLVDYTSPLAIPKLGVVDSSNYPAANLSIQKRLEKLQHYEEPPELSPIILKKSKRISLDFRSPVCISDVNLTKETLSINHQSSDSNIPITEL
ncbi:breast cancer type 2 susceptibility protein homolog [Pogonomyrmex barbatus]|uniref:Breast cancer type 2 susceptibility protein homolog n=1 Tax=Pogonomyrmex barbatus TaxID=144034 RepID=A0A6I9W227_9HYME|nr:breast cancer type 2 susceptibility protein homolog [Pogonomyrmex barbatus]